ncbi:MAG: hypothetical protein FWD73_17165 [Polyangiaceae bacterium]|nr:hypothetical protein [Polyangiaceae bacterium]
MLKISFCRSHLFLAVAGLAGIAACSSASTPQTKAGTNAGATRSTSAALTTANDALAAAGTLLFPTGVDADGNQLVAVDENNDPVDPPIPDPHYTVTSDDPNCNGTAYIIAGNANPGWASPTVVDPGTQAQWISCATPGDVISKDVGVPGVDATDYTYTTTLTIPDGVPALSVQVTGNWACDNWCKIIVNDTPVEGVTQPPGLDINNPPDDNDQSIQGFKVDDTHPIGTFMIPKGTFKAGENTIKFVVRNTNSGDFSQDPPPDPVGNPEGLLITDIQIASVCTAGGNECGDDGSFICTPDGTCAAQIPNGQPCLNNDNDNCVSGVCGSNNLCGIAPTDACTPVDDNSNCQTGYCQTNNDDGTGTCQNPPCTDNASCNDNTKYCDNDAVNADNPTNTCLPKQPDGSHCTADTAVVCLSGVCSANGTCMPAGGCNEDADCTNESQPHCNTATNQCVPAETPDSGTPEEDAGNDAGTTADASNSNVAIAGGGGGTSCSVPAGANHGAGFGSVAGVTAIALAGLIRRRRSSR